MFEGEDGKPVQGQLTQTLNLGARTILAARRLIPLAPPSSCSYSHTFAYQIIIVQISFHSIAAIMKHKVVYISTSKQTQQDHFN